MGRWFRSRDRRTASPGRSDAEAASDRVQRLESVTEAALSHLALDELLDALLSRIRELLDVDTASVLLRTGDVLIPTASKGFEEELGKGIRIPVGQGFAGRVAAERRPILIEEASEIEIFNPLLREKGLRSLLGVPLLHRGEVIGVVHVGTSERRRFTPDEVITLQLVADRVAMAISQARVFEAEREARGEAEAAQRRLRFLAEASELLASSLDYESTLERVAELAVPEVADYVVVDIARDEGTLERLAIAHVDSEKADLIRELSRRYRRDPHAPFGSSAVVRTGSAQLVADVSEEMLEQATRDEEHFRLVRSLGARSYMSVPLTSHDRVFGAMTFVVSDSKRRYTPENLAFAKELARRAAAAIDNARLYAEAEERARAVLVLDHIGEGVVLLDRSGIVRLWNPAAESITGLAAKNVVGRPAAEAIPGWKRIAGAIPVAAFGKPAEQQAEALPLDIGEREIWLLISGVDFPEGTVFAFRDVTQERALRDLQTEFVATVSHELRTPLAAVYGAAMTLREHGDALDGTAKSRLFSIVYDEADRLNRIVNDILWASRLDSGRLEFAVERFEPEELAHRVLAAAKTHAPDGVSFELTGTPESPLVAADADKLRQVLGNLVDNAVKYSPDGGTVEVRIESRAQMIRFAVSDRGIGIPLREQPLIFEKFYRLDPNQTRGVGGTGLGLYICRELVRRMNGRIWVDSEEGEGSTFFVELPVVEDASAAEVLAHLG
jgi:signal transduction histidine kinase/GAF domain-containing protein